MVATARQYGAARLPEDEDERIGALRKYRILDTEPERAFDRVTSLAARFFEVPIAFISLVDSERQWFKSCVGLEAKETSRDVSFCAHAILSTDPLVIPDTEKDPRFAGNPHVVGAPFIRFYAGAPLPSRSGHNIGTLCVVDTKPRDVEREKLTALRELAAMVVDELELRIATRELEVQSTVLRSIFDSAGDGIVVADENGKFQFFNQAAERILGMGSTDASPSSWSSRYGVFHVDQTTPFPAPELPLARALRGEPTDHIELFIRNPMVPGGVFISLTGRPMRDPSGKNRGGVVTFADVTELRKARAELAMLATTDPLTGLPNKRAFAERLDLLVAEAGRGRKFALVMADVDHFKRVNDTFGHSAGDEVLVAVSRALKSRVRKTDLVARCGGEEFCILITDVDDERAVRVAEKLREAVATITDPVNITASFGVCTWGVSRTTGQAISKAADEALYQAKREGRNRVVLYQG
ncbi:MAG TPA: diguanylate cyclase [Labilithrix sp.]|nr:diguanylate cyclase [Labilithrix sp.]